MPILTVTCIMNRMFPICTQKFSSPATLTLFQCSNLKKETKSVSWKPLYELVTLYIQSPPVRLPHSVEPFMFKPLIINSLSLSSTISFHIPSIVCVRNFFHFHHPYINSILFLTFPFWGLDQIVHYSVL